MYIYQADTYCDSCGRRIAAELIAEGLAPDDPTDERSYDSDDFPKWAPDDEECDSPDHCASGVDCLEPLDLLDYGLALSATLYGAESTHIGALLSANLTPDGVEYLRDMLAEARTPYQEALHRYWRETFADYLQEAVCSEAMFAAYVECALWSSVDFGDDDRPLDDNYGADDLADETRATMRAELSDFLAYCEREGIDVDSVDAEQVGHDFWLTRNHHGAGFWDRGLGELGERLTTAAHSFGEAELYPGDDGRLYQS